MRPVIGWHQEGDQPCLKFTFGSELRLEDATAAIDEWRKAFDQLSGHPIVLIWDARELTDYDSAARKAWQKTMKELRNQIDTIWLITQSNIVTMGATVMSIFSSLDIKVVRSEDEIEFH